MRECFYEIIETGYPQIQHSGNTLSKGGFILRSILSFELNVNCCILEVRFQGWPKTEWYELTCLLTQRVPGNMNAYVFYGNNAEMASRALDSVPSSATE